MNATQEVREQYKQAARTYIEHINTKDRFRGIEFYEGRMSGLDVALSCLGVTNDEVREMYNTCEKEVIDKLEKEKRDVATASALLFSSEFLKRRNEEQAKNERANEDIGPGDVSYDEEGFIEQGELDAIERPVSQAKVEKESEEDIYECEHCNAEFRKSETLYRQYGGGVGIIAFCPRCKGETKLICVTDIVEARK